MSKRKIFKIETSLTEALEESMHAAENYPGQLRVEALPLKKIEVDPDNPRELIVDFSDISTGFNKSDSAYDRKKQELENLQSMAESIKREGLINPIVVYKHGDKYRLVAGERRALASMISGQDFIQAKILDKKPEELKLRSLQWVENVERENLSLWERLNNLEKIIKATKNEDINKNNQVTPADIKQLIGCSWPNAMSYSSVINANEVIKKSIEQSKIKNLEKAALIAQITIPKLQEEVMAACIEGATLKQMKKMVSCNENNEKNKKDLRIKMMSTKGRRAIQINLGNTKKIEAVKFIMNLVMQTNKYDFLKEILNNINWNDFGKVANAFKSMLKAIEENE